MWSKPAAHRRSRCLAPPAAEVLITACLHARLAGVSLDNLGGVWVGDRTKADRSRKFMPNSTNVVRVPSLEEIAATVCAQSASCALNAWQLMQAVRFPHAFLPFSWCRT